MIENSRVLGLLSSISQEWIKGLQNPQQRSLSLSYWNVVIYQIIKVLHPGWMWRKVDVCVLQLPVMCLWTFFLAAGSLHFTSWAVRYWSPVRSETSNLFADSCEHLPQRYLPLLYFSIALSDYANCLFLFCFFLSALFLWVFVRMSGSLWADYVCIFCCWFPSTVYHTSFADRVSDALLSYPSLSPSAMTVIRRAPFNLGLPVLSFCTDL